MPIVEVNGPNTAVNVIGNVLSIQSFELEGVTIPAQEWDLSQFQKHETRTVRFFAGIDGEYHINDNKDIFWLVCEVKLPPLRYESVPTGKVGEDGQEEMEQVVAVPDFEQDAIVKVWTLPQGGSE